MKLDRLESMDSQCVPRFLHVELPLSVKYIIKRSSSQERGSGEDFIDPHQVPKARRWRPRRNYRFNVSDSQPKESSRTRR